MWVHPLQYVWFFRVLCYSWIGHRWETELRLVFGLSMFDFTSKSRFRILMKNYTWHFHWIFDKTRIDFLDFLLALYGVTFLRFWCFASTMVALASFLGKSVTNSDKWGCFGKPGTSWFTRYHRRHIKMPLTCITRPCSVGPYYWDY